MAIKGARYVTKFYVDIKNIGPLHIGEGEDSILIDKDSNKALMPGTSIAGALKAYVRETFSESIANKIFGSESSDSKLYVYDSISDKVTFEQRPSLKINPSMESNFKGHKFDRYYIGPGQHFTLTLKLMASSISEKEEACEILLNCFKAIHEKQIVFGGYKTAGAGQFEVKKVSYAEFDLHSADGLFKYLRGVEDKVDITSKVYSIELKEAFADLELICSSISPILIKGQSSLDSDEPDEENIKNSENKFIIPGSSIKGVLRAHCRRILNYFGQENLLTEIFGSESDVKDNKVHGRFYSSDAIIDNEKCNKMYFRIKINKFTGGVINGALVKSKPVEGEISFKFKYKLSGDETKDDSVVALLILALRDIATGDVPIGSGSSVGRGRVCGSTINLKYKGQKVTIDMKNKQIENQKLLDKLIEELNKKKAIV